MDVTDKQLKTLRMRGVDPLVIASRLGVSLDEVEQRLHRIWSMEAMGVVDLPPNELTIQLEASAIRMGWSREEERKRRSSVNGWTPPDLSAEHARILGHSSVSARG